MLFNQQQPLIDWHQLTATEPITHSLCSTLSTFSTCNGSRLAEFSASNACGPYGFCRTKSLGCSAQSNRSSGMRARRARTMSAAADAECVWQRRNGFKWNCDKSERCFWMASRKRCPIRANKTAEANVRSQTTVCDGKRITMKPTTTGAQYGGFSLQRHVSTRLFFTFDESKFGVLVQAQRRSRNDVFFLFGVLIK